MHPAPAPGSRRPSAAALASSGRQSPWASVAGASKLLERAVTAELLVEITQRRSWRLFLPHDLAVEFGYAASKRRRPAKEPPALPASRALVDTFDRSEEHTSALQSLMCISYAVFCLKKKKTTVSKNA